MQPPMPDQEVSDSVLQQVERLKKYAVAGYGWPLFVTTYRKPGGGGVGKGPRVLAMEETTRGCLSTLQACHMATHPFSCTRAQLQA